MNGNSGLSLRLINRYTRPVKLDALGNLADGNDSNGATDVYEWDLSAETWVGVDTVSLEVKYPADTEFSLVSTFLGDFSVSGVVRALNTLNVGSFNFEGNTIYIPNSNIEYRNLSLLLGNVDVQSLKEQAYEHFVPLGVTLQSKYPTFASWEAEYGEGFDLLIANTSAAAVIATYGISSVMPYIGSTFNTPVGSQINFISSSPKSEVPVFSTSAGVLNGYNQIFGTAVSDVWVLFPSGDANEVTSMVANKLIGHDVFYHDPSKWRLNVFSALDHGSLISLDGMLQGQSINTFYIYNNTALTVPAGWKYPAIDGDVQINELRLAPFVGTSPTITFTNPDDFAPLTSASGVASMTIKSKDNISFPSTVWNYNDTQGSLFLTTNGAIRLDNAFNTMFESKPSGVTSFTIISAVYTQFDDLLTPIRIAGLREVSFTNAQLTDFPPIDYINNSEITTPTQVTIDLDLRNNSLPVAVVNDVLIDMDAATSAQTVTGTCKIELQGQFPSAPPSGAGLTARTNLISRGFTVITD